MKMVENTPDYLDEVPWWLSEVEDTSGTFTCMFCERKEPHVWHDDGTPNQDPLFEI